MSSVNVVLLTGFCSGDPQVTTLDNGVKVANFSLATSHPYKNKAGEKVDQTFWHRIVVFRGGADIVEKYVKKGSRIAIQGQLRSRNYEDKEGSKRTIVEVYAEKIELLGHKSEGDNNSYKAQQQAEAAPEFSSSSNDFAPGPEGMDDLPFN